MYTLFRTSGLAFMLSCIVIVTACEQAVEHLAPAVNPRDSVPTMVTYGVNTLISDSGIVKYRIVTERYEVNQVKNPLRWTFDKGVFLEEFDENFHVQLYIQCDTAYYYDQQRLWELRGRVRVKTKDGVRFYSEELYRDENRHELYSNKFSRLITSLTCLTQRVRLHEPTSLARTTPLVRLPTPSKRLFDLRPCLNVSRVDGNCSLCQCTAQHINL